MLPTDFKWPVQSVYLLSLLLFSPSFSLSLREVFAIAMSVNVGAIRVDGCGEDGRDEEGW